MAQVIWVFLDDFGKRHRVGIYHGDQSGHLLIHCDRRIVQVDFAVKEPTSYSFFIEDELCEIKIFREEKGFSYAFEVNKKVDTPRNRLRKQDERRNKRYMVFFLVGLVVLLGVILIVLKWYDRAQESKLWLAATGQALTTEQIRQLNLEGKNTLARVIVVEDYTKRRVFYNFKTADSLEFSGALAASKTGPVLLPNGFPLTNADEFAITYLPADPSTHRLNFGLPTENTIINYLRLAVENEQRAHPEQTASKSLCRVNTILKLRGWRSLAPVIFQDKKPSENKNSNAEAYQRLIRDPEVVKAFDQECWDK